MKTREELQANLNKANADLDKAYADWDKAIADRDKADAALKDFDRLNPETKPE